MDREYPELKAEGRRRKKILREKGCTPNFSDILLRKMAVDASMSHASSAQILHPKSGIRQLRITKPHGL